MAYPEACIDEADGDAAFIAKVLGDIARAKGMSRVARDAGLSRKSLYKALSGERTPGFDTILEVRGALGIKLRAEAALETSKLRAGDLTGFVMVEQVRSLYFRARAARRIARASDDVLDEALAILAGCVD